MTNLNNLPDYGESLHEKCRDSLHEKCRDSSEICNDTIFMANF